MTPSQTRPTAKIYQFPSGGRAALGSLGQAASPQVDYTASGSGWYHEAAIEDAKRGREH